MRGVIYARFSSHNQTEQSIEGQMRDCLEYAKKNDIQIVGNYIDRALSATTDNRPEFQKMIRDSDKHLFEVVLVWKLDRFSRNRYDSATYKARLRRNGVRVVSVMENISDEPEGILVESLLEGMAEYYSAELSQKITRGMRETAFKCKVTGGNIALGFKIGADKRYEIDEAAAPVVVKIFEMYASGVSPKDIFEHLNGRGFKTSRGVAFNKNSIRRMLTNPRYIGIYKYKDIEIPGGIPQIIDNDLFERVQKMIKKNKKSGATHKAKVEYLLTTKLFCGHCKSMMVGESGTGRHGSVYHYYKCVARKRNKDTCRKENVGKKYIEDLVINNIVDNVLKDDVIARIADKAIEIQSKEKDNGILDALTARLKETDKSIENMLSAIEQGVITKSTKRRLDELEKIKGDTEYEILKEQAEKPKLERDMIVFLLDQLRDGDTEDIEYRKRLINTFVSKIYLYDDKLLILYNYTNSKTKTNEQALLELVESGGSDTSLFAPPLNAVSETLFFFDSTLVQLLTLKKAER